MARLTLLPMFPVLLPRLLTRLHKRKSATPPAAPREVLSAERLRGVLARERARADRLGDRFCLVTFAPREAETAESTWDLVVEYLRRRLRMTDDAGWLKDGLLAAVLPHTPSPDAWKLADDLCRGFPEDLPPPLCEVYCYPTDPGEDGQGWTKALGQASDGPAAVRPMEPLFAQPLEPWKRGLDLIGAVVGLLLTAPLFLFLAAAIKLTSRGPVFYRQQRSGLGGKPFTIYKFRTMVPEAEARKHTLLEFSRQDGPAFKMEDDPRVTRVGRFLRITSLDELPQLWNVLRGEMSLVGPRPLPCAESDASEPWHRRRLDVTPGVTCIWQVRGRSQVSFAAWVRMDLEYIARRSIWFDLQLLLETIPAVFFCRGM